MILDAIRAKRLPGQPGSARSLAAKGNYFTMTRRSPQRSRLRPRRGFTFLEIMLVVAIIGILAAIVGPRLVGRTKKAKIQATRAAIQSVKTALGSYEMNVGNFPSSSEGLKALVEKPSGVSENDWEKCMDSLPRDAWGEEFIYAYPSSHNMDYDLTSKGPDRQEGTEDDLNNWDEAGGNEGDL